MSGSIAGGGGSAGSGGGGAGGGLNLSGLGSGALVAVTGLLRQIKQLQDESLALRAEVEKAKRMATDATRSQSVQQPGPLYTSASSNFNLSGDEVNRYFQVACTSACSVTLPPAVEGAWLVLFNSGTANLSVKTGSTTTICVLRPNASCFVRALVDGDGVPAWPTSVSQTGQDGTIWATSNVVIDSTSAAVLQKASDGHYYQLTMSTSGRLITSDQGTTAPSIAEAEAVPA